RSARRRRGRRRVDLGDRGAAAVRLVDLARQLDERRVLGGEDRRRRVLVAAVELGQGVVTDEDRLLGALRLADLADQELLLARAPGHRRLDVLADLARDSGLGRLEDLALDRRAADPIERDLLALGAREGRDRELLELRQLVEVRGVGRALLARRLGRE